MNPATFDQCLTEYLHYCETTSWVKDESYKFFFANWLFNVVNLELQDGATVLRHCKQSLREDYSLGKEPSVIGVPFLQKAGYDRISVPITIDDIQIIKYLRKNDIPEEEFFYTRGMSYTGLSGWLGTLLPKKFVPVVVTYFSETIPYLFGLGGDFPKADYAYFIEAQKYFKKTKDLLIERRIHPFFLERINAYRAQAGLGEQKKRYYEIDWNWVTQDFHLFVYRVHLNLIAPRSKTVKKESQEMATPVPAPVQAEPFELYTPPLLPPRSSGTDLENRGLTFSCEHYLDKYASQLAKGTRCELFIKQQEQDRLSVAGRSDLADKVKIVSDNPDYGFDIQSFEVDGTPMQIEVKAIPANSPKSFFITAHELKKSTTLSNYCIYCVYEGDAGSPEIFRLRRPNLDDSKYFIKEPIVYTISFL